MSSGPDIFGIVLMVVSLLPFGLVWLLAIAAGAWILRRHRIPGALLMIAGTLGIIRVLVGLLLNALWQIAITTNADTTLLTTASGARTFLFVSLGLLCQGMLFAAIFGWRGEADEVDWDEGLAD